jgi:hypothetical protein
VQGEYYGETFWLVLFLFYPEDGGSMFLPHVSKIVLERHIPENSILQSGNSLQVGRRA